MEGEDGTLGTRKVGSNWRGGNLKTSKIKMSESMGVECLKADKYKKTHLQRGYASTFKEFLFLFNTNKNIGDTMNRFTVRVS